MMIQIYKASRKYFLCLVLFLASQLIFASDNWIIGAEKFKSLRGKQDSVTEGIVTMFPSRILEKLSENLYRSISPDEKIHNQIYTLKNERTSLFLQLSGETKRRDSLVTYNYSEKELKRKIADYEKKIQEIKDKISENLIKQQELEQQLNKTVTQEEDSSFFSNLYKTAFGNGEAEELKKVELFAEDFSVLFEPSAAAASSSHDSLLYEKEVASSKIDGLITGNISLYGDYFSLTVELYLYPGAKKVATVTEVGSLYEADLISTLIARELTPAIVNSFPVKIQIEVEPKEAEKNLQVYFDNEIVKDGIKGFTTDAGVHSMQFICEGFNTLSTSYSFSGNKTYKISLKLKETATADVILQLPYDVKGNFYLNGISYALDEENQASITINNTRIPGIFIGDDKSTAFFVIPENAASLGSVLDLDVKPFDRNQYIEKRRRRMYNSYSILLTSLMPTLFCYGQFTNYSIAYNGSYITSPEDIKKMQAWQYGTYASAGVSIGCGAWFVYELVQYFRAANSVLPVETKKYKPGKYKKPEIIEEETTENDIIEDGETEK